MSPSSGLARLFSPSRGSFVRRQRKYTHGRPARRRRRPRDARDPFHRREMRNEKETPPNSRLSRLRLADSTFCDRSIDGDGDTADARARRGVDRSPRARAMTEDERDARRTEEEDIFISGVDDDVAIRVRNRTRVLLKQTDPSRLRLSSPKESPHETTTSR